MHVPSHTCISLLESKRPSFWLVILHICEYTIFSFSLLFGFKCIHSDRHLCLLTMSCFLFCSRCELQRRLSPVQLSTVHSAALLKQDHKELPFIGTKFEILQHSLLNGLTFTPNCVNQLLLLLGRFPKDDKVRQQWEAAPRGNSSSRLCSRHFIQDGSGCRAPSWSCSISFQFPCSSSDGRSGHPNRKTR